jgi:hypothetical protein
MEQKQFDIIERRLSSISKLLGANLVKDLSFRDQVKLLGNLGLSIQEISEITGKTTNNVKVTQHYIRKSQPKEKQEKQNLQEEESQ